MLNRQSPENEQINANYKDDYYKTHRKEILAKKRAAYAADKEKKQTYYQKNKEKIRIQQKDYKEARKKKSLEANKEANNSSSLKRQRKSESLQPSTIPETGEFQLVTTVPNQQVTIQQKTSMELLFGKEDTNSVAHNQKQVNDSHFYRNPLTSAQLLFGNTQIVSLGTQELGRAQILSKGNKVDSQEVHFTELSKFYG